MSRMQTHAAVGAAAGGLIGAGTARR
jgi:hypothetical protein